MYKGTYVLFHKLTFVMFDLITLTKCFNVNNLKIISFIRLHLKVQRNDLNELMNGLSKLGLVE